MCRSTSNLPDEKTQVMSGKQQQQADLRLGAPGLEDRSLDGATPASVPTMPCCARR
jgi:hypothetical protein